MNLDKALWKTSQVFAPDFPRQSSSQYTIQDIRYNRDLFCTSLRGAIENEMPGYYSVYSFPRGHSTDENIPKVDCVFIDLDIDGDSYDPKNNVTDFDGWRRDMSELLVRVRMIANEIIDSGQEMHYRATLSGHKGLHLYLDFPTIAPTTGDFNQFKNGLKLYGEKVMNGLDSMAGGLSIEKWVDVDASDLGRLSRHPNTVNHGAAYDEQTRWCVPVTIEELTELHVDDYLRLTESPRLPDGINRTPSKSAGSKVVEAISDASSSPGNHKAGVKSEFDEEVLKEYDKEANEDIELEDIAFLTSNYPCIKAFRNRDDAFSHGNASHLMEVNVIGKLVEMNTPRTVIHEWLEEIPGYNEQDTKEQIEKIIGRQYKSFDCTTIAERAPSFCLGEQCAVYNRGDDIQK